MTVYFSTDWTLNDSLLTEVDNVITLHPQEIGYNGENVCLIATNELNEVIATSGCGEEEPLITEKFIRFWAESGFPSQMDIEISELYLEDNQLPENPSEIYLETESYKTGDFGQSIFTGNDIACEKWKEENPFLDKFGNAYKTLQQCENGEIKAGLAATKAFLEMECQIVEEEFYNENPTGGEHSFHQILVEEGIERKDKDSYLDFVNFEKEARNNLIDSAEKLDELMDKIFEPKHVLIKRANLPKRVDFSLLPNASGIIWSALTLLKDGAIDINHEIYQHAVLTANNLDLFMSLMPNPKFATVSSFQIEKQLNK